MQVALHRPMLSHHNVVPETQMPYLQLDVNERYSVADKRLLAKKMSETYARMMSVDIRRISVAIRELGEGGVWRIAEAGSDPVPVSVMMLDIRRSRSPELRMEVAKALCKHCVEILGLREDRLNVEFTQHSGDEMYHPALGGYSPEWEPGEQ
jgi:phenylpyruvate tautomerase PptA (4-oxalocrotonate tautomerase family)